MWQQNGQDLLVIVNFDIEVPGFLKILRKGCHGKFGRIPSRAEGTNELDWRG